MNVFKRKRLIWVQIIIKNWIIENAILELWLALAIVVYEMIIANSYRNAHSWDNCSVEDKVRLLRLVLFPILLFFRLPSTIIFIDREIHETIPLRFRRCFSPFYEKNSSRKTFVVEWLRSTRKTRALYGQALVKGGNFGGKLIHLCDFWLEVSFFSHVKNHRSRFWLDVSFFLHEWKPSFAPLIG